MQAVNEEKADSSTAGLITTSLAALGIVYGDIGTSPLYAFKVAIQAVAGGGPPSPAQVLGVLSLIVWSLVVIISIKYVVFVMRADNHGEGGILALLALVRPWSGNRGQRRTWLLVIGIFGATLLYGDGVITPAISVLSAVEGLEVATPLFGPYVKPLAVAILIMLFAIQHRGTAEIGRLFGPVMAVWFAIIALLGLGGIMHTPQVAAALDPRYALALLTDSPRTAFVVGGAVFLAVTGGEALYADMGHVGRRPIRFSWFVLVLPALLLNYAGQAAIVLADPSAISNPFFHLAPTGLTLPLVVLATAATVIASQALISGVFSLTRQAILMGLAPRMRIIQTSTEGYGQIYLPAVNYTLMILTLIVAVVFHRSDDLAAAYGIAVSATMLITTLLLLVAMREHWQWPTAVVAMVAVVFITVDVVFLAANLVKLPDGGWLPLTAGGAIFVVMDIWRRGNDYLFSRLHSLTQPLDEFLSQLPKLAPHRPDGVGVFMTKSAEMAPAMMVHHLRHHRMLQTTVVFLVIVTEEKPKVSAGHRLEVVDLGQGCWRVTARYGFMQTPNIPVALRGCERFEPRLNLDPDQITFYVGHESVVAREDNPAMTGLAEWLFAFMARNATDASEFFRIPEKQVVEIGIRVEI
ncbi:putative potassium transport system protein Kup 1 [uncultured Gammaproteobacteria bacterium]